jgi:hypothetical protein
MKRRVSKMLNELGHVESSPLERKLIEQSLVCWVSLYLLEINLVSKLCESLSTETGLDCDKRLTGAQRRIRRTFKEPCTDSQALAQHTRSSIQYFY